ncbi:MAG TPA: M48 family metallopeptidase [Ignavibacteria bacterium]
MKYLKTFLLIFIISIPISRSTYAQLDSIINMVLEQSSTLGPILANLTLLSDEDEMNYGDRIAEDFNKNVSIVTTGQARVEKAGGSMIKYVDRNIIKYKFRVIETDEINAFAIAGGNVYVTTALLDFVDNEDQLAFVIGHEIGHVDRKHSAIMVQGLALAYSLGGSEAEMIAGIAYNILSTPFTKYQEYDADQAGAYFSKKAGYDPYASLKFFDKLSVKMEEEQQRNNSTNIDYIMRSHPWSKDRATRIKTYIDTSLK